MRDKKIYCPCNGWDCPHYQNGECALEYPLWNCDDFGAFWAEDFLSDEPREAYEN